MAALEMSGCHLKTLRGFVVVLLQQGSMVTRPVWWKEQRALFASAKRSIFWCDLSLDFYKCGTSPPVLVFAVSFWSVECFIMCAFIIFKFLRNQENSLQSSPNLFLP